PSPADSFLLSCRPQPSPLFPYTTLFRSALKHPGGDFVPFQDGARCKDPLQRGDNDRFAPVHAQRGGLQHQHILVFVHHQPAEKIDRKSTRLNSSHRTISYAVFCSKKKKV